MDVIFNGRSCPFTPWKPSAGRVFSGGFAMDCETTLIDDSRPWIVPTFVLGAAFDGQRGYFLTRENTQPFLQLHDGLPIVFHNAAFDLKVVAAVASDVDVYALVDKNLVWDTMLLHKLCVLGREGHTADGQSSLADCAKTYLDIELAKEIADASGSDVRMSFGKFLGKDPREIPQAYLAYLAKDVMATFDVCSVMYHRLIPNIVASASDAFGYVSQAWLDEQFARFGPLTHHIQLKASIVLDQVSRNGLHLDSERTEELRIQLDDEVALLRERLRRSGYIPGQKGSGKTLQEIMKRIDWKCEYPLQRTPTGKYSTTRDDLEEIRDVDDFIDDYLEFQAAEKLRSTFVSKMQRDCLHPSFSTLKRSGRTSSFGEINAQNLPRGDRVRSCFVPSPGNVFIDADYCQVEMATLAQTIVGQLRVPSYMAAAINDGTDLHRLVASRVLGKDVEQVSAEERQRAKPINFGKPGGMGDSSLMNYAKKSYGVELSESEVTGLTNAWFSLFPEMLTFLDDDANLGSQLSRYFNVTPRSYFEQTGDSKFLERPYRDNELDQTATILGWMFRKTLRDENPKSNSGKYYSSDEVDFFWSQAIKKLSYFPKRVQDDLNFRRPSNELMKSAVWLAGLGPCISYTGRLRASATYCARHNTLFQGLAADGAKLSLWKLWREGFRIVNFIHDEALIEVPENSDLAAKAERIRELMIQGMSEVAPDVQVDVEYAASDRWQKSATAIRRDGKLLVWNPAFAVDQDNADDIAA